ncbi:MAG: hypothetical protein U0228_10485 [Myxococcaceae bacterium]
MAPNPLGWNASAVQISGLLKELKKRGLDKVVAQCSAEAQAVFGNPFSARWHPGHVLIEVGERVIAEVGGEGFADVMYQMARNSFGPILRPMLQVAMAMTGRTPAALLARVPTSIQQAVQNVTATWTPATPNTGTLVFQYPCPIPTPTEFAWRGSLRFLSELAGTPIRVEQVDKPGHQLVLHVAW